MVSKRINLNICWKTGTKTYRGIKRINTFNLDETLKSVEKKRGKINYNKVKEICRRITKYKNVPSIRNM